MGGSFSDLSLSSSLHFDVFIVSESCLIEIGCGSKAASNELM